MGGAPSPYIVQGLLCSVTRSRALQACSDSGAYLGFGGTRSNHYPSGVHLLGDVVKPGSTSAPELSRWVPAPAGPLPSWAWFKT